MAVIRKPLTTWSAIRRALSHGALTPQGERGPVMAVIDKLGPEPVPVRRVRQGKEIKDAYMVFTLEGWCIPREVFVLIEGEGSESG